MTWANYADNFMTGRTTGVLTYRNTDFFGLVDGLSMGIQYQGKNDRTDVKTSNGDGVGYSLGYSFAEGFSVIGAYSNSDRTNRRLQTVKVRRQKHGLLVRNTTQTTSTWQLFTLKLAT
jgi:outer membrane pore protein F